MCFAGFVNRFLSWSAFRPLSKLVYGVLLVHDVNIHLHTFTVQVAQSFSFSQFVSNVLIIHTIVSGVSWITFWKQRGLPKK